MAKKSQSWFYLGSSDMILTLAFITHPTYMDAGNYSKIIADVFSLDGLDNKTA